MIELPTTGGYRDKIQAVVPGRPWWWANERGYLLRCDGEEVRVDAGNWYEDARRIDEEKPVKPPILCSGQVRLIEAQQAVYPPMLLEFQRKQGWSGYGESNEWLLGGNSLMRWAFASETGFSPFTVGMSSDREGANFLLHGNHLYVTFLLFCPLGQKPWTGCMKRPWERP